MVVDWLTLLAGLAFGLIPGIKLLNTECRFLTLDDIRIKLSGNSQPGVRRRRWWKLPLVWIDPFRGYVTAWLITDSITPGPGSKFVGALTAWAITYLLLALCIFVQTKGRELQNERLLPAGFLMGVIVAIFPPVLAISILVVAAATAWAASGFASGLMAALVVASLGGFFLDPNLPKLALKLLVVALPLLATWWCHSRLVLPMRI